MWTVYKMKYFLSITKMLKRFLTNLEKREKQGFVKNRMSKK